MTDKDLSLFFDSITNLEEFLNKIPARKNILIKDGFGVVFHDGLYPVNIDIIVNHKKHVVGDAIFSKIIRDIIDEKTMLDSNALLITERLKKEQKRKEIFDLGNNTYKVYKDYITFMYSASDIASVHGLYLKQLQALLNIFNKEGTLLIEGQEIKSKTHLIEYLKSHGFNFIDSDIH